MKVRRIFVFAVGLCLLFFGTVSAKENYRVKWKNDELSNGSVTGTIRHMLKIDDGLLVGGYDDFYPMIIKLDNEGKEVKKLVLDYEGVINGIYEYKGNYYFIVTNDDEYWNVYVYQIDKDLNIVASKATGFYEEGSLEITNLVEDKLWITTIGIGGFNGFGLSDDNDYYDSYYIDLDDFSTGKGTSGDFSGFTKSQQMLIYAFKNDFSMPTAAYVGHGFTLIGGNQDYSGWGNGYSQVFKTDDLDVLNNALVNGNLPSGYNEWDDFNVYRELPNPVFYTRMVEIDNHIIAGGENYAFLDLFDLEGNLVEQINLVEYLYNKTLEDMAIQVLDITTKDEKLYVAYQYCDIENDCSVNCKPAVVEIRTKFNIETTVVEGEGTIEAAKVANYGDEVQFTITPATGYVLSEVRVTDTNGNVVVFEKNTFTMPSADVLIEVIFAKENTSEIVNPETLGVPIFTMAILLVLSLIVFVVYRKKAKDLM